MRLFLADAFTRRAGAGNPAHIVVCDAEPVPQLAADLTATLAEGDVGFIWPDAGTAADVAVLFMTPRGPAPFIAHVTLAAHAVRQKLGLPAAPIQRQATGLVHVEQRSAGVAPAFAISQPPPPLQRGLEAVELASVCAAVGLAADQLDSDCPAWIAGGASRRLLLAVNTPEVLAGLRPERAALLDASRALGVAGVFVYARTCSDAQQDTESRMFAPALGIDEDAVSGNAHGMLACYLWQRGLLRESGGMAVLRGAQGAALGRPGEVRIELSLEAGKVQATRIVGNAIVNRELAWPTGVAA